MIAVAIDQGIIRPHRLFRALGANQMVDDRGCVSPNTPSASRNACAISLPFAHNMLIRFRHTALHLAVIGSYPRRSFFQDSFQGAMMFSKAASRFRNIPAANADGGQNVFVFRASNRWQRTALDKKRENFCNFFANLIRIDWYPVWISFGCASVHELIV
jgi:hypothetical protein